MVFGEPGGASELLYSDGQTRALLRFESVAPMMYSAVKSPDEVEQVGQEMAGVDPPLDTIGEVAVTAVTPLPDPLDAELFTVCDP